MTARFTKAVYYLFFTCYLLCSALYLSSLFISFPNPSSRWFLTLVGYLFPLLLAAMLLFLFFWIIRKKKRKALITLLVIILGWKNINAFFAFGSFTAAVKEKSPGHTRVMTWNVMRMGEIDAYTEERRQVRRGAMKQISLLQADILCLQEFHHATGPNYFSNIPYIKDTLGFHYFFYSKDFQAFGGLYQQGSIIFSKYPIIDSGKIKFPPPTFPESLIYADVKIGDDTVRVFTTHLQSLRLSDVDTAEIQRQGSGAVFSRLKRTIINRGIQAKLVRSAIDDSPHPVIVCADLNDTPNSYTYFEVKGNRKDAFLQKGFGPGRTFSRLSPTLRIDYIFTDKAFSIKQVYRVKQRLSDHYGLVADLQLPH